MASGQRPAGTGAASFHVLAACHHCPFEPRPTLAADRDSVVLARPKGENLEGSSWQGAVQMFDLLLGVPAAKKDAVGVQPDRYLQCEIGLPRVRVLLRYQGPTAPQGRLKSAISCLLAVRPSEVPADLEPGVSHPRSATRGPAEFLPLPSSIQTVPIRLNSVRGQAPAPQGPRQCWKSPRTRGPHRCQEPQCPKRSRTASRRISRCPTRNLGLLRGASHMPL